MNQVVGKYMIFIGAVIIVCGIMLYFFHDSFKWLGRLPGDVRIERKKIHFYFPFVTMLLISVLITVIINLIRKIF